MWEEESQKILYQLSGLAMPWFPHFRCDHSTRVFPMMNLINSIWELFIEHLLCTYAVAVKKKQDKQINKIHSTTDNMKEIQQCVVTVPVPCTTYVEHEEGCCLHWYLPVTPGMFLLGSIVKESQTYVSVLAFPSAAATDQPLSPHPSNEGVDLDVDL